MSWKPDGYTSILRVAFEHALPLLDLRLICDEDADYANPIEPSSYGGAEIARVAVAWARGQLDRAAPATRVFAPRGSGSS